MYTRVDDFGARKDHSKENPERNIVPYQPEYNMYQVQARTQVLTTRS